MILYNNNNNKYFVIIKYIIGFFNKEVELIVPPKNKKNDKNDQPVKAKSLNGYDAIREKIDEGNTLTTLASAMRQIGRAHV